MAFIGVKQRLFESREGKQFDAYINALQVFQYSVNFLFFSLTAI